MKRALAILGWLGFALVGAAVILRFTKPDWPGVTQALAIAGLVVTIIYALSQWRDIGRSFEGKNVRYGSIAAGSVLVFVAILVAVNWLANRQNKRWDLTESKQFSLSDQTKQILGNLKSPLTVHVFHGSQDSPQRYRDRFEEYQYQSKQINVEYINAEGKPAEAEKYQITAVPTIVMEYAGRTQRATSVEEQAITNALKKLIEGKTKKAYFLQGHGEHDPDDASGPRGYKGASNALADENFEVAKLTLAQAGAIPADASLLVIAGPTTDVLPQEADLITAYVKNGGKLMLLIDPPGPDKGAPVQATSLIALAKSWGIQVGDDIVVDPSPIGRTIGTDASVPIGMPTPHPITANFRVITAFPLTRSVTAVEGGADGKFAQSFVQTGDQSWAETDVKGLYATKQPEKNVDKGDKAGPISVAAAVSAPAAAAATPTPAPDEKPAPEAPKAESRLAVIGDSDFATNRWLSLGGNNDLFLNTANWLAQQEDLIAIRPRDPEDRRIELTEDQQTRILWITLVIIPLALFGNAFRVYWKRR